MNIWFALWVVLSVTLIGFLLWSLAVLRVQKQAWKTFAQKNNLRYAPGKTMENPEMDGMIEGYKFNFFTGEHQPGDTRFSRRMTAMEVTLLGAMPIEGGVASGGMIPFLKSLGFAHEVEPQYESWNKAYMAAASSGAAMRAYLTEERVQALVKLMQVPNAWVIFVFRKDLALLRIDTPNPLTSAEQIEKLQKIMLKMAKILELKNGESHILKTEEAKAPVMEAALKVDEKALDVSGLALEDE